MLELEKLQLEPTNKQRIFTIDEKQVVWQPVKSKLEDAWQTLSQQKPEVEWSYSNLLEQVFKAKAEIDVTVDLLKLIEQNSFFHLINRVKPIEKLGSSVSGLASNALSDACQLFQSSAEQLHQSTEKQLRLKHQVLEISDRWGVSFMYKKVIVNYGYSKRFLYQCELNFDGLVLPRAHLDNRGLRLEISSDSQIIRSKVSAPLTDTSLDSQLRNAQTAAFDQDLLKNIPINFRIGNYEIVVSLTLPDDMPDAENEADNFLHILRDIWSKNCDLREKHVHAEFELIFKHQKTSEFIRSLFPNSDVCRIASDRVTFNIDDLEILVNRDCITVIGSAIQTYFWPNDELRFIQDLKHE